MSLVYFGGGVNAIVCMAGPVFKIVASDGRRYEFEFHHFFGPSVLGEDGEILERQPGARSAFYPALEGWIKTGGRVCPQGYCVWRPKPLALLGRRRRANWIEADVFQDDRCCQFAQRGKR